MFTGGSYQCPSLERKKDESVKWSCCVVLRWLVNVQSLVPLGVLSWKPNLFDFPSFVAMSVISLDENWEVKDREFW
jgi:hypothetical protein